MSYIALFLVTVYIMILSHVNSNVRNVAILQVRKQQFIHMHLHGVEMLTLSEKPTSTTPVITTAHISTTSPSNTTYRFLSVAI